MSSVAIGWIIFGSMLLFLAMKIPIGYSLIACTLAGVIAMGDMPVMIITKTMFSGMDSFTIVAVPLFILTGNLMALGGITKDLMGVANALVGWLRGGLAYVCVVASMIFAGITGSGSSEAASIGSIIIPPMIKQGYRKDFTVALVSTASTIGVMIPPSIPMVLYAVASGASIGRLFVGGIGPGLLVGFALILMSYVFAKKQNYPREAALSMKQRLILVVKGFPAFIAIIIMIGGIITGFFTPTEAAGIACIYALLMGMFYYKEIYIKQLPKIIAQTGAVMGMVSLMIASATSLGYVITSEGISRMMAEAMQNATDNKFVILLLLNLFLLFIGTFMDLAPSVIIFTPILMPIVNYFGIDPVHFGVVMTVNVGIGLLTPPVALPLFISCGIAKIDMMKTMRMFIPFFLVMVLILFVITFVPQIIMFLPNLLMPSGV